MITYNGEDKLKTFIKERVVEDIGGDVYVSTERERSIRDPEGTTLSTPLRAIQVHAASYSDSSVPEDLNWGFLEEQFGIPVAFWWLRDVLSGYGVLPMSSVFEFLNAIRVGAIILDSSYGSRLLAKMMLEMVQEHNMKVFKLEGTREKFRTAYFEANRTYGMGYASIETMAKLCTHTDGDFMVKDALVFELEKAFMRTLRGADGRKMV